MAGKGRDILLGIGFWLTAFCATALFWKGAYHLVWAIYEWGFKS